MFLKGRKVSQSLKLPETEPVHIEKRSNTVSGAPLNIRLPQQESGSCMPSFQEQKTQEECFSTSQPAEESCSQDTTDNETQHGNSLRKESIDTSTPNHKKRSRHSSDRLTTSQKTSRSGSRSPSVHHLPSVNTSAYHSTSDLSTVSGGNMPPTESERKLIIISKMLDVMNSSSSKTVDSESVIMSESGDEHDTPQLMTTLEQIREQCQQPKRSSTIKSDLENTLVNSQDSGRGKSWFTCIIYIHSSNNGYYINFKCAHL